MRWPKNFATPLHPRCTSLTRTAPRPRDLRAERHAERAPTATPEETPRSPRPTAAPPPPPSSPNDGQQRADRPLRRGEGRACVAAPRGGRRRDVRPAAAGSPRKKLRKQNSTNAWGALRSGVVTVGSADEGGDNEPSCGEPSDDDTRTVTLLLLSGVKTHLPTPDMHPRHLEPTSLLTTPQARSPARR